MVERTTDKLEITEYECFLDIEANGDNVFCVAPREPPYILYLELMFEQEFFVVWARKMSKSRFLVEREIHPLVG